MSDPASEWARCEAWLAAALEHSFGYEIEDVRAEIVAGEAQFWPGRNAAIVTQVWTFPRAKAVNFWLAGGDLAELVDEMRPCVEAWARAMGCTNTIIAGRAGWARALKDEGYRPIWTALGKELKP